MLEAGVTVILHYLDDFLTMGQKESNQCATNLRLIEEMCVFLGFPLKVEKAEGPAV